MQLNQWKRETAGSQMRREEEANSTLPKCHHVAQCPYYCKEFGHSSDDHGMKTGGKQLHAALLGPALCQRRTGPSFPCRDGEDPPRPWWVQLI